ncbi:MAG: ABC transporter ATP-binding protein [Shimia sp.]
MRLDVRDLTKTFPTEDGPLTVLDGVSLTLAGGDTVALTGESGSGKSTLLHVVGGLEPADGGHVSVDGAAVTGADDRALAALRRDRIGIVFQQFNLIPSLSVGRNLAFHAALADRRDTAWEGQVAEALGIAPLLDRYPEQLSGGQQQRVAIGRALAARPALILADEPTGNLDETSADAVMALLVRLTKEADAALLMVTHSVARAEALDRRLHLSKGRLAAPDPARAPKAAPAA